ncbi:ricin-type beta-trefoil lectin domain protein [Streptomyces sp. FH025]|uniref:RICIN domain-containing protein n=1 Tax=Streptomyces sp. FH025 TaxID=2815937 RepID=UPI001A9F1603|nr:ricin-type beta-trefoil lectin domain protein [Streptomyces sp. FH025]MBO1414504.1 RICIN domain-containing protein [Streptomyces sp. FH025]
MRFHAGSTRLIARTVSAMLCLLSAVLGLASPAAAAGSTPGTYSYYGFPSATSALRSVAFGTTVQSDPGRGNVFWSHQFAFTNGVAGYIGMQRHRTDPGMFLFSLWGSTNAQPGDTGTYCQTFTESGGGGYTCRLNAAFAAGHHYRYDITPAAPGWYQARISDTTAGTSFVLGTLQVGTGLIRASGMIDWVEYFDWNNNAATCADEPYSAALFTAPTGVDAGTGQSVTAAVTGTSLSSTCANQASVTPVAGGSIHRDAIGNTSSGSITGIGGQCVDITGNVSTDGTRLELWPCGRWQDNQNWVLAGNGTIHALFKCMTASGSGTANGTPVVLSTCNGSPGQQWVLTNGTLVNPNSHRCLDATNGSSAPGTKLELWDCNGGANQQWHTPS